MVNKHGSLFMFKCLRRLFFMHQASYFFMFLQIVKNKGLCRVMAYWIFISTLFSIQLVRSKCFLGFFYSWIPVVDFFFLHFHVFRGCLIHTFVITKYKIKIEFYWMFGYSKENWPHHKGSEEVIRNSRHC